MVVILTEEFFGDERFGVAAEQLNEHRFMTEMRVIRCWRECYNNDKPNLSAREIRVNARWSGELATLIDVFVDVGIVDRRDDGTFEFHGVAARLQAMKEKSASARVGGLARAKQALKAQREAEAAQLALAEADNRQQTPADAERSLADAERPLAIAEQTLASAERRQASASNRQPYEMICIEIEKSTPLSPPLGQSTTAAPSRRTSKRDPTRAIEDEAIRVTAAALSIALDPPSGETRDEVHDDIRKRVPRVGRRVVEKRFGHDGWRRFVKTIQAAAESGALPAAEAQLRKAIAAELRAPTTDPEEPDEPR